MTHAAQQTMKIYVNLKNVYLSTTCDEIVIIYKVYYLQGALNLLGVDFAIRNFLTANCFIFYGLCHDVLLPLCLLYIYSYLFYCFMSENSSLELMFMFIQPTLSFLYALLVSRVGKYD